MGRTIFGHWLAIEVFHWTDSMNYFHHFSFLQFDMKDITIIFPSPGLHSPSVCYGFRRVCGVRCICRVRWGVFAQYNCSCLSVRLLHHYPCPRRNHWGITQDICVMAMGLRGSQEKRGANQQSRRDLIYINYYKDISQKCLGFFLCLWFRSRIMELWPITLKRFQDGTPVHGRTMTTNATEYWLTKQQPT